jgi:ribosome-associated protein
LSLKEPMGENEPLSAEEKGRLVVEAIQAKKGHQIVTIDLSEVEHSMCDRFIICHGESTTQVGSIAQSIEKELKEKAGIRAHHIEGMQNSQWVLIDLFDVLVHVFLEDYRSFYKLEELWADGKVVREKE